MTTKPYSWIVRLDVAPEWVADGFSLGDQRALEMLGKTLSYANMSHELAARVLVAPSALRIAREQGYGPKHPGAKDEIVTIMGEAPHAYADMNKKFDGVTLDKAITDAIKLLDRVPFVVEEGDETGEVLTNLRKVQALVRGDEPISDIEWVPTPD